MEKEAINNVIKSETGLSGDFYSDLNACHSMENALDNTVDIQESDLLRYYRILSHICCDYPGTFVQSATAIQRCEAFLKTLGLWEEESPENQGASKENPNE